MTLANVRQAQLELERELAEAVAANDQPAMQAVFEKQAALLEQVAEQRTRERWDAMTPAEQEQARAEHRRAHPPKRDWVGER